MSEEQVVKTIENGKAAVVRTISLETALSIGTMLVAVAVSWATLSSKIDSISDRLSDHIEANSIHPSVIERQQLIDREIELKLAPIMERLKYNSERLDQVVANQQEVLRILGRRPPNTN